ncbi:MAG: thioredoxin family protein [Elusimicrobia bacterium]|nr:thioredoxin family protein [Elusimicrobiota bacterium]
MRILFIILISFAISNNLITAEQLKTKTKNTKVTFIELGSVNCIPCRMMQPIMKEIKEEYGSQVKVVFHDVWTQEGQPYAKQYKIMAIPTQVFLDKDGKEFHRHIGFYPKKEIIKVLKTQGVK